MINMIIEVSDVSQGMEISLMINGEVILTRTLYSGVCIFRAVIFHFSKSLLAEFCQKKYHVAFANIVLIVFLLLPPSGANLAAISQCSLSTCSFNSFSA